MQVGDIVKYKGKKWKVACFFPDSLGLHEQIPYNTWEECFKVVGIRYEIKVQLYIKHDSYTQYESVNTFHVFNKQIQTYYKNNIGITRSNKPLWKDSDLVPNPSDSKRKRFKLF